MRLSLLLTSLFCLTCLVACENNVPADQLTVVQGAVIEADTKRPLANELLAVESYVVGFGGPRYQPLVDSVRTDAQGKYEFHFYNKKGLYYLVSFAPPLYLKPAALSRYTFLPMTQASEIGPSNDPSRRYLTLGAGNVVNFTPNELQVIAVRIRNRNTRYQRMYWESTFLRGNNLDTTAYLHQYLKPANGYFGYTVGYQRVNAMGTLVKDTAVALVVQNPAALPPDTLRATLTFVR